MARNFLFFIDMSTQGERKEIGGFELISSAS